MVLQVDLPLCELLDEELKVRHMKGLIRGGAGVGSLETTKPKSVTAGIWRRGWWYVIWFGRDERELEIQVVKDPVMDSGEMLEFKLGVPGMEPFEECDFVVVEERSLEDISDHLTLLCVRWRVVDMTRNGGLSAG